MSATSRAAELDASLPPGRRVELPGRGTTLVREMPGPPGAPTVVLLHGWTATADLNWGRCYQAIGEHYRVVALDQRGHGLGIRSPSRFRLADCADDVAALAAVLGLGPFIVAGYSMGGPIALLAKHRHPGVVSGLVLCATAACFAPSPVGRAVATWAMPFGGRFLPRAGLEWVGRNLTTGRAVDGPYAGWVRAHRSMGDPAAIVQAGAALARFDARGWVGELDLPAAVVVTSRDRAVAPSRQRELAARLASATVHPVPGDHTVCFTHPRVFLPGFLDACESVASRLAP